MTNQSVFSSDGNSMSPTPHQNKSALENRRPMKAWVRWLLIITQVGGGFTGVVMVFEYLISTENLPAVSVILLLVLMGLYGFVVAAGMKFAIDKRSTSLLRVALWMQIPRLSSPIITWWFSAGLCLNLTFIGGQFGLEYWLGSYSQLYLFMDHPLGIGVNVVAVLLLILLGRRQPPPIEQPATMASQIDSIIQTRMQNTPLAHRGIRISELPGGDISILVDSQRYASVSAIPDEEVKALISSAIQDWQKKAEPHSMPG